MVHARNWDDGEHSQHAARKCICAELFVMEMEGRPTLPICFFSARATAQLARRHTVLALEGNREVARIFVAGGECRLGHRGTLVLQQVGSDGQALVLVALEDGHAEEGLET